MAITVGAAAQRVVQTPVGTSSQPDAQSASGQAKSEAQPQAGRDGKNAAVRAALTPAIRQAAHLVAGPLGEVAVTMAAGAVGALLDTRA